MTPGTQPSKVSSRLKMKLRMRPVIKTATGSCTATVEITTSTSPGVVSLPHGHGAADVNQLLTTDDVDTLNGMPIMSGFAVTVSAPDRPSPATPARTAGATRWGR